MAPGGVLLLFGSSPFTAAAGQLAILMVNEPAPSALDLAFDAARDLAGVLSFRDFWALMISAWPNHIRWLGERVQIVARALKIAFVPPVRLAGPFGYGEAA